MNTILTLATDALKSRYEKINTLLQERCI